MKGSCPKRSQNKAVTNTKSRKTNKKQLFDKAVDTINPPPPKVKSEPLCVMLYLPLFAFCSSGKYRIERCGIVALALRIHSAPVPASDDALRNRSGSSRSFDSADAGIF